MNVKIIVQISDSRHLFWNAVSYYPLKSLWFWHTLRSNITSNHVHYLFSDIIMSVSFTYLFRIDLFFSNRLKFSHWIFYVNKRKNGSNNFKALELSPQSSNGKFTQNIHNLHNSHAIVVTLMPSRHVWSGSFPLFFFLINFVFETELFNYADPKAQILPTCQIPL